MRKIESLFTALLCVAVVGCIRGDKVAGDRQPAQPTKGVVNVASVELDFADGSSQVTDTYNVTITNAQNAIEARGLLASMSNVALAEGEYVLTVESMLEVPVADWEKPYYVASRSLSVSTGDTVQVGKITAELRNAGVSVEFTERFRAVMTDYKVNVTLGLGRLTYSATEKRTGYFRPTSDKMILTAELSGRLEGKEVTEQRIVRDVKAGDVKLLTFDVKEQEPTVPPTDDPVTPPTDEPGDEPGTEPGDKPGDDPVTPPTDDPVTPPLEPEEGNVDLKFVIDVTVSDVDVVGNIIVDENDREPAEDDDDDNGGEDDGDEPSTPVDPDQPTDLGVPTIVWEGHNLDDWYDLIDGSVQVALNISAPNKIKTLVVDIISEAAAFQPDQLQSLGLDAHLDLGNPGTLREAIEGLGFPVAENVVGKTALVFDISQFMPLMGIAAEDEKVEFRLTLTDEFGHEVVTSLKMNVNLQ